VIRLDRCKQRCLRKQLGVRSYGGPVLEWWRPGGSVLAISGQGSQAYLSLPPGCDGVSESKQNNTAHIKVRASVRTNGIARKSARAVESVTPPEPSKGPSATSVSDGCGSLGQVVGAQGALIQPGCFRGCEHTLVSPPGYAGDHTLW